MQSPLLQVSRIQPKATDMKTEPKGVGGLLLLFCVWLTIISPLFKLMWFFADDDWQQYEFDALFIEIVLKIGMGVLLWMEKRLGWWVANIYFILNLIGFILVSAGQVMCTMQLKVTTHWMYGQERM